MTADTPIRPMTIRPMTREELSFALDLAAGEGWNPGLTDAETFYEADPGGFLVGELAGEKIGCISAVRYGESFGFIGLYIVRPEFRGKGYGLQLWQAAMDLLTAETPKRNIGLDGVVAQQENYAKSGFARAFRSVRFRGEPSALKNERDESAVDLSFVDPQTLMEYDRACFPEAREDFLRAWVAAPGTRALAWMDDGWLAGYGVIRPCREGWKIGPLFADHRRAAEGLFDALCSLVQASEQGRGPVFLDVPEPHGAAVSLAESRGMVRVFETARMYTRRQPDLDASRIWGVTTFELG